MQKSNEFDAEAIRSAVPVSAIVGRVVALKQHGGEFQGLCPFHNEKSPSFTVNDEKGFYHCFGCGAHGDVIGFAMKHHGMSYPDAAKWVCEEVGQPFTAPEAPAPAPEKAKASSWTPIVPVPENAPPAPDNHPAHGKAAMRWEYLDAEGRLVGLISRFNMPDGGKEIMPLVYCESDKGRFAWRWQAFPKPRPLYGLELLATMPEAPVIVVEGEKAAAAGRRLFSDAVVTTWPGGSKAVKHADWSALAGRKVVIWPDNDEPGTAAALDIAKQLAEIAAGIRVAVPPSGKEKGWDCADAEAESWDPDRAFDWLRSALVAPDGLIKALERREPPPSDEPPPFDGDGMGEHYEPMQSTGGEPFRPLGYDHGRYYYLALGSRQVIELAGAGHTKGNLLMLAPLAYWERDFPAGKKGCDWDQAANALIRRCEAAGVYNSDRVRGRGAWWHNGEAILHLGDRVIINGTIYDPSEVRGWNVYEAAAPIRANVENPLTAKEAVQLVELCKMLSWEKSINATLLAGWCVVAVICGALRWRPHIWITGEAGSGKTWVYENILVRLLGEIALPAASETTEPGLRAALGSDARPVLFDEAEGTDRRSQERIQNVLALMRQASAETSAAIYKGTNIPGQAARYQIRSCFGFCSIGVGLKQNSDQSRVAILNMTVDKRKTPEERGDHFARIQKRWLELLTPEYIDRFHARIIRLIPTIRKNAETFAVAAAKEIGTQRLGDKIGAILAGAYALHSNAEISVADAEKWVAAQDWADEAQITEERDDVALLQHILQHVVTVEDGRGRRDRSIAELVEIAYRAPTYEEDEDGNFGFPDHSRPAAGPVSREQSVSALRRIGIRLEGEYLLFSNTHTALAKLLSATAWSRNWGRILKRLDGSHAGGQERFGAGPPQRTTAVPVKHIFGA